MEMKRAESAVNQKSKEAAWEAAGLVFSLLTFAIIMWGVAELTIKLASPIFLLILVPFLGALVAYAVTRFLLRERK